jgi:luciferase family oxidoreductase group 1
MVPLSVLDLAPIVEGSDVATALRNSIELAQQAERWGYNRFWLAEHHNAAGIASAATAVLIGEVAAATETIRVGAGGIMLPNHSPLVIAEQFGTLAALHPGRIDLGLGRAPGTDQLTMLAIRPAGHPGSDTFPQDVLELQAFLGDETRVPGVHATPGRGTNVPLYILGSSLFGAQLAALLGLPFGFASHFAPDALHEAVAIYRTRFQPSEQLQEPYVIAGVNVITADTEAEAQEQLQIARRGRVRRFFSRDGAPLSDDDADFILRSPQAVHIDQMMKYTAVGAPDDVNRYLDDFARGADADELMIVFQGATVDIRLHALELVAKAAGLAG